MERQAEVSNSIVELFTQPILQTKITAPQVANKYVHRPRLTRIIKRGIQGPLTLLTAPAGFGKTHLLIEWTKETDLAVAWLTLDNQDNNTSRFFSYFISALQIRVPGIGEEALQFIQSTGGSNLEAGMTLLINEISTLPKEIILVLDDFQILENQAALQRISFLLKYLPPNLHLLIASRSEPELDMAFLRAKGRVMELGADELRFTNQEVGQYFRQVAELRLTSETLESLEERTNGWITPLQMAAISLKNHADPVTLLANLQGKAHYLADFLAKEVLERQPEEIRQFLLRSSILETLTGPLCEAVVNLHAQTGYGTVMLHRLEHANLFIMALDEKHEWFRYHPVFSDFLRQFQADANPAEIPELHKQAAMWLEQNGHLEEAYRHALASDDMEWAADMIQRNSQAMLKAGEISTLTYWIGKLPEEVTRRHPYLILTYAWALIATHQTHLAQDWLDDLTQMLEQLEKQATATRAIDRPTDIEGFGNADLQYFHGSMAVCRSHLAILNGNIEQAAEFSQQAANYLEEENLYLRSLLALDDSLSVILSGDTQKAIESLHCTARIARQANNLLVKIITSSLLADLQVQQGQISKAWETLQRAQFIALGLEGNPLPLAGLIDIGLGEILLERNLLEKARDYLERGCQATQAIWYLGSLDGMVSIARLCQAQGNNSAAQAIIDKAARMALSSESSQWDNPLVSALAVRLALQRDDLAVAEYWWKKGGFPDLNIPITIEKFPYHIYEYILITQARFLLAIGQEKRRIGDLKQAAELLATLLLGAERFQRVTSQIQILVLQAMVQSALGEEEAAKTLLHALALGEPEGYRQIYLDEGWQVANLLRQCRSMQAELGSHLPSLAFIDNLLKSIQRSGPTAAKLEGGFTISLSAREIEVLALIAEGRSNQEISSQLFLALNTVKRHTYNIFAKLEVEKRTQAVMKARQLGLVL
jgi:LuxR family maltose regulon positive regulatory protein